ncbi:MAG: hypothetical protein Q4F95_07275 [Oscillospiraceae bacterium]|nr:hypothetical protein [Oscillospiraceae bacterium]
MDKKYFDTAKIKGRYQQAIAEETASALQSFCSQEPEFKQAIEQSGKTYQDCLDGVVKGAGMSLSDLKAYKRAVKFYFSTADISFQMTINLSGDNGYKAPPITVSHPDPEPEPEKKMELSLDDFLDF